MQAYSDADKIVFTCCCTLAILAMLAYGRWHYWWKTGFSRARMAMMISFAGLTLEHAIRDWNPTLSTTSTLDHVLDGTRLGSAMLASAALGYLLISVITINIRRVREPGFAASQGRRHIERTPGASREEVEKLLACWDESRSYQRR